MHEPQDKEVNMLDIKLDTKLIKETLIISNITPNQIDQEIVNFNNGKLGIIDGSLSEACCAALNNLLPKNVSTMPVAAMESHAIAFGKYKPLHAYACEQKQVSNEVMGMLYVYSESDKDSFNDTIKLNETSRLMSNEQKAASVVYCPPNASNACIEDACVWAKENGFAYTQDMQLAVEHWSGKRKIKI